MAKRRSPIEYAALNPGIRVLVRFLRDCGFETISSGDGVTHECACDPDFAFVTIRVKPKRLVKESRRLAKLLEAGLGLEMGQWSEDGQPEGIVLDAVYIPTMDDAVIQLAGLDDTDLMSAPNAKEWEWAWSYEERRLPEGERGTPVEFAGAGVLMEAL